MLESIDSLTERFEIAQDMLKGAYRDAVADFNMVIPDGHIKTFGKADCVEVARRLAKAYPAMRVSVHFDGTDRLSDRLLVEPTPFNENKQTDFRLLQNQVNMMEKVAMGDGPYPSAMVLLAYVRGLLDGLPHDG